MSETAETRLAAIVFKPTYPIDALLEKAVDELRARRLQLAGVIQTSGAHEGCDVANVRLRSLRDGWEIPVLQDRGPLARGCRLNPRAITEVAGRLAAELADRPDLLIVNRFGRAESEGYGLRQVLEEAVCRGIPVLVGVREDYVDAWQAFHGGMGETLPTDANAVAAWCLPACGVSTPEPADAG